MPLAPQIESVRSALAKTASSTAAEDFRVLMEGLVQGQQATNPNALAVSSTAQAQGQATQAAPSGVSVSVAGANGVYTISINNGNQNGRTVWNEISYSTVQSFTAALTTMAPTAATSVTINLPGKTLYFRCRSSFDQKSWSAYQFVGDAPVAPVSSGLVSAAAQEEAVAFNQTNYAVVSSAAVGGAAVVTIAGPSGSTASVVRQKGSVQSTQPGGVVANVPFGTNLFVGYSQSLSYVLKPTLADVLADNLTPVGKVSVVDAGSPTLPTIILVLGSNGEVIAWNVTNQGNGLSAPVNLTINTSTGSGATPGTQTIQNGKLISVAPGNPGLHYAGIDTVTASGGIGTGTVGGGTAAGGNGGRMTAV